MRGRRVVEFTCDECGETNNTYREDFQEALQIIKNEGWRFQKGVAGWEHYCPQCK
jgi:predicted RNA-binding Zn-ribbon protein involved in translation (DUF1610 family)